ncbi:lysozyme inhibitor LprI family protein [Mesorhizobium sp. BR1-1-16]|uniref:lysozyme inhibitor LprI family protein n=1 Tax=Mesorhizobium sp. BR1-1-16 TaxID=2876653 RepID=UPI001CC97977|nr:lysozyme inhibitor LprI family protein [Mesorhizobium sp. BR1-1-16]MBZ9935500.1 lysozyme inhibitor LprI family protein [Mesorhizobium sp. BR1-1-16]
MKYLVVAAALLAACLSSAAAAESSADRSLNAEFKKIEARLAGDADTKKLFVESQRKWIAFRDAECAFQASQSQGGSVYPTVIASCQDDLTAQRIKDFKRYLSCEEGDLSCPVPAQ